MYPGRREGEAGGLPFSAVLSSAGSGWSWPLFLSKLTPLQMCLGSSVAAMYSKSASEGSSICGVEQLRSRQAAPLAQTEICAAELEKEEEEEEEGEEGKGRRGGKEANNGRAVCER